MAIPMVPFFFCHSRASFSPPSFSGHPRESRPSRPIRQPGSPPRTPAWIPTFGENDGRGRAMAIPMVPFFFCHSRASFSPPSFSGHPRESRPSHPIRQAGSPPRTPAWIPTFGENDGRGRAMVIPMVSFFFCHSRASFSPPSFSGHPRESRPSRPIRQPGRPPRTPAWIPAFGENDGRVHFRSSRRTRLGFHPSLVRVSRR